MRWPERIPSVLGWWSGWRRGRTVGFKAQRQVLAEHSTLVDGTEGEAEFLLADYPKGVPADIRTQIHLAAQRTRTVVGAGSTASELTVPAGETALICGTVGVVHGDTVIIAPSGLVTGEVKARHLVVFGRLGLGAAAYVEVDDLVVCSSARIHKTLVACRSSSRIHPQARVTQTSVRRHAGAVRADAHSGGATVQALEGVNGAPKPSDAGSVEPSA